MNTTALPHSHRFDEGNPLAERNTWIAVLITAVMMVAEIAGGWVFNSMALLADGWHMSSHALALGLSALAYIAARRYAADTRFAFGTWKIEILGGFSSAILLLLVAGLMLWQSVERLLAPVTIHYEHAILVAVLGLGVNLVCARLLHSHHQHGHEHPNEHAHEAHGHADLNQRAAYLHVVADAATSVLAIVALVGGRLGGADWLDPAMGIVGAILVAVWAVGLLRQSSRVLLDAEMDAPVVGEVREVIAGLDPSPRIDDLHVWRVGREKYACIISLTAAGALTPEAVRQALAIHEELAHVSVEINPAGAR